MAGERYVEITKEEMEKFIKNSYRPYRPKPVQVGHQLAFVLKLSNDVGIRVHTSLSYGRTEARGVGEDAIEVFLVSMHHGPNDRKSYLMSKATLRKNGVTFVMRTKSWRSALDDRVDKLIDIFEGNPEYWNNRAKGGEKSTGPSPQQLKYILVLVDKIWQRRLQNKIHWSDYGLNGSSKPTDFSSLTPGRQGTASSFIEHAKAVLEDAEIQDERDRELNDERGQDRADPVMEPKPAGTTASFTKLPNGKWGLKGKNLVEGTWVVVTRRDGQKKKLPVGEIFWTGSDGMTVAHIPERGGRRYAEEGDGPEPLGEPTESADYYGEVPQ